MLTGTCINELIADAGSDRSVDEFITVTLDGTGTSTAVGVITSYAWAKLGGPAVDLSDTAVAAPSFEAPETGAAGAVLEFQLTVANDTGMVSTDEVIVNVLPIITDPEVPPPAMIEMTDGDTDPVEIEATTGAQDVVLMRFEINLDYAVELSSLSLQATGDGDVTTDVSSVSLYADVNENGVVDADDILIGEGQYAAGGVLELVIDPAYTIESGRRSFIVAYDFNP